MSSPPSLKDARSLVDATTALTQTAVERASGAVTSSVLLKELPNYRHPAKACRQNGLIARDSRLRGKDEMTVLQT
jgi:hypothetical protein